MNKDEAERTVNDIEDFLLREKDINYYGQDMMDIMGELCQRYCPMVKNGEIKDKSEWEKLRFKLEA